MSEKNENNQSPSNGETLLCQPLRPVRRMKSQNFVYLSICLLTAFSFSAWLCRTARRPWLLNSAAGFEKRLSAERSLHSKCIIKKKEKVQFLVHVQLPD